jgi:hypothetical protein
MAGQNPIYPDDRFLTDDQVKAKSRAGTLLRAISPGELICVIDGTDIPGAAPGPAGDPNSHLHSTADFMQWRHDHVVGDQDPWTYYLLFDQWAQLYQAPPPIIPPPPPPTDWQYRASNNPRGIPYFPGWCTGDWTNISFTTIIGPGGIQYFPPGSKLRITVQIAAVIGALYIGPLTTKPLVASALYPVRFGGNVSVMPPFPTWIITSDEIDQAVTADNGLMISGWISGPMTYGLAWLAAASTVKDWYTRWIYGNHAADLDKSSWRSDLISPYADLAVLSVESFYP